MNGCFLGTGVRRFFEAYYNQHAVPSSSSSTSSSSARRPSPLLTSFDGCSVLRGGEHTQQYTKSWLHVDQNMRTKPDYMRNIQCAINLLDGNPTDHAGFVCIPKSHLEYKRLVDCKDPGMVQLMHKKMSYLTIPALEHSLFQPFLNEAKTHVKCIALAGMGRSITPPLIYSQGPPLFVL